MTKGLQILAMLLLLVVGVAGPAAAQDFGDEGPAPTTSEPSPNKSVRFAYDKGKVIVIITAPTEEFGFRLWTRIPMEVDFVVQPGVEINIENLLSGQFDPTNGSDFRLISARRLDPFEQDGMIVHRVLLEIHSAATFLNGKESTTWVFNSVFLYSSDKLEDGRPNWKKATSPNMVFTRSPTAVENSKNLAEGDLSLRRAPHPTVIRPVRYAGSILAGFAFLCLLWWAWIRFNPPRELPANVIAWKVFDDVLKKSDAQGITMAEANRMAAALRSYLKVESLTREPDIKAALETFYGASGKRYELARQGTEAIAAIDKALYERQKDGSTHALSAAEAREVYRKLELLVPRP